MVAEFEKQPDKLVRVIVTVRPGPATTAQVAAAAKAAGASTADPIKGQPLVVIEGKPAHLRAVLGTGQVLQMQRDGAAPTN
jgi:hypothetical protein